MILRRRPRPTDGARTLLVDHWYSHAVGHVVEALRRCLGYHAADPGLRTSLVLNGASPVELARCAPFLREVYGVPYPSFGRAEGDPRRALRGVPRDWDHVVHHLAATDPDSARFEGVTRYYAAARRHFRARVSVGTAGQEPPAYLPHQRLRLDLPADARARAGATLGDARAIAVLPAGSGARFLYPSVASWLLILDELERRLPGAALVLVGRHGAADGRTASGIGRDEVARLAAERERVVDAFDLPILDQLALVERTALLVSPHSGFAFAALAVGTPWLALSGGDWHEYFFNGVPFHSVLPRSREHPVFVRGGSMPRLDADTDGEGPRARVMSARRIREDLDELGDAAARLVAGEIDYEEALAGYFPRLLDAYGGDRSLVHAFDGLERDYL